jgi:hypothetical protein
MKGRRTDVHDGVVKEHVVQRIRDNRTILTDGTSSEMRISHKKEVVQNESNSIRKCFNLIESGNFWTVGLNILKNKAISM